MAVFAFIIGSVIGFIAGLVAWLVFGVSILTAFGIYLGLSLVIGMTLILFSMIGPEPAPRIANA